MIPRRLLSALALAAVAALPAAADDEPLITDRPDFTESAATVTRGRTQLEFGYTFTHGREVDEHALGEVLLRVGMTEELELRLGLNSYVWQRGPGPDVSGLEDLSIGVKARLSDPLPEGAPRPQVAVLMSTTLATGSSELSESGLQPKATLALAWALDGRTSLGSNLSYARLSEDGDRFNEVSGSLSLGRGLSDQLGVYLEWFGFDRQGARSDDQFLNAGLTWALSDDGQLDFRAGAGLNSEAPDYFVGAGAAWRW